MASNISSSEFFDSLCGSELWDWELTWYTEKPYFTPCFENTVLVWFPCAFLWMFVPMDIYYANTEKSPSIPWTILNIIKSIICVLLVTLQLILIYPAIFPGELEGPIYPVQLLTPAILSATFILALVVLLYTKLKGVRSSGVQFIFWFLLACCEAIHFRSVISPSPKHAPLDTTSNVVKIISSALIALQLFLNCWADAGPVLTSSSASISGKPCPEKGSSYISRLLFHWYNGLAIKAFRKPLEFSDLWVLNDEDKSKTLVPVFNKHWENSLIKSGKRTGTTTVKSGATYNKINGIDLKTSNSREPADKTVVSIMPALLRTFGATFFFGAALKIVPDLMAFVSPQILDALITFVTPDAVGNPSPKQKQIWHGYMYAGLLFLSAFVQTLFISQYSNRMYLTAMRVRTVLVSAVYRKALVISSSAKRNSTLGEIVNYMSVDVQKIMDNIPFINMIWSAPVQIAVAMYFLWTILGPSTLAGLTVIILLIPANGFITAKARKYQSEQMKYKDQRIKLVNEILSGVKVLKLYAWEPSFEDQIRLIRDKEVEVLRKAAFLSASTNFLWTCAPFLVSLSTFGTYVLIDDSHVLDARKVFVSMSLFNIINLSIAFVPMIIIFVVQAGVSLKRINRFMNSEEIDPNAVSHDESEADPIVIENGTFAWEETATLQDINLRVKEGSLVAIVGTVGSGKTSLLSAMLGELEKHSGRVNTKGTIGYVAQQAWIQNTTLRDNITFGNKYDPIKYNKVIEACALKPDIQILPAGDQTEIGEKGINLSGGQKQRVALARATYTFTDMYLFDDPLSAVDAHVGKHIFERVIGPKGYLKRKTRVLVTHGISFLPQMDQIFVMKDGRISESGTYQELMDKKGAFAEFLTQHITAEDIEEIEDDSMIEALKEVVGPLDRIPLKRMTSRTDREEPDLEPIGNDTAAAGPGVGVTRMRSMSLASSNSESISGRRESKLSPVKDRLIEVEKTETEGVKLTVYVEYFKAAGWILTLGMLFLYMVFQGFAIGASLWLSKWADEPVNENGTQSTSSRDMYLGVYGTLGFFQSVAILAASMLMAVGTLKSAAVLHQRMLSRILKAPMSFFDTTPLGRIVNRFAKDIDVCDNTLPFMIRLWLNSFLSVVSTLVIISYTTPIFIAVIIPIGIVYYFIQRIYVSSSRQLKRIESVSRSPIYSHFGETVAGAVTIRGFGQQERFISDSESKVDHNQVSYFPAVTSNRWLAIRLEAVGNFVILFAAIFAVLSMDTLEPGLVGLSISYALQITMNLNILVRWTSDLETNIVSVERVKEYTETPIEAPWEIEDRKPPKTWPETGEVIFDGYQSRYRDGLELVLRNVTCTIKGGEKVGIVGRTGAGKSSMTLAIFRIVEAAGGSIVIDGQNISKLGLHDVRGRITIIPQDPVLFSGTLRINLDPFENHTDAQLWRVLELAHLKTFASTLQAGLSHEISEGGENLSVGQRQLVCLARALLRHTKVIVLDEATAAVDLETDDLIQATIRKEFADATVITIAHRLNTIMDSNRVIVLDKGEIREFDTPENLMSNKLSIFYGMAKDAGISS